MKSYERSFKLVTENLSSEQMWNYGPNLRFLHEVMRQRPDFLHSELIKVIPFRIRRIERNNTTSGNKYERQRKKAYFNNDSEKGKQKARM